MKLNSAILNYLQTSKQLSESISFKINKKSLKKLHFLAGVATSNPYTLNFTSDMIKRLLYLESAKSIYLKIIFGIKAIVIGRYYLAKLGSRTP